MAKYLVRIDCIEHYQVIEIEARDKNEAAEKYQDMIESGEVLVVDNDFINLNVQEQGNEVKA